jgi:hypothetical protein
LPVPEADLEQAGTTAELCERSEVVEQLLWVRGPNCVVQLGNGVETATEWRLNVVAQKAGPVGMRSPLTFARAINVR